MPEAVLDFVVQVDRPEAVADAVRAHPAVRTRGGGTKTALRPADGVVLDLSALRGVVEYEPSEFTFTALAGTPVREVEALLARHGQYLPFDPPLAAAGATLGGTVASGLSGPRRYRYGGVRDFIVGCRFVDGEGRVVRAGGKVVKNAAGFDFPKLLVGSLGTLGVLVELSFKVFPRPPAHATLRVQRRDLQEALGTLRSLATSFFDVEALDLVPPSTLWIRVGGLGESLPVRVDRLRSFLGGEVDVVEEDAALWEAAREFAWLPSGWSLVKVPTTPRRLAELESRLGGSESLRRYSVGGNVAWVGWPGDPHPLSEALAELDLRGLRLVGPPGPVTLGRWEADPFGVRVKHALDPTGRLGRIAECNTGSR